MRIKIFRNNQVILNKRAIAFFLILFQSCGIRFFEGQGILLCIIILLLVVKSFFLIKKIDLKILIGILLFLFVNKLLNPEFPFSKLIFQYALVVETWLFLVPYRKLGKEILIKDLYYILSIIFFHSLIGFALFLLAPALFTKSHALYYPYKNMLNIFFVTDIGGQATRNNGICWEPGLLQLMLNLYLFYNIKNEKRGMFLLLIVVDIFSTFSTTGFIILSLNYLYFLSRIVKNQRKIIYTLLFSLLLFIPLGFIKSNIIDKFSGENTSGLVRYRDFLIGLELIKEKPFLGHGNFDNTILASKSFVNRIEQQVFTEQYLNLYENLSGGYTNGLLGLFCWYGLPLGLLIYSFLYRNSFITGNFLERWIFFLIIVVTLYSEPITYTSFFLIFPLSYVVLKTSSNNPLDKKKVFKNKENFLSIKQYG